MIIGYLRDESERLPEVLFYGRELRVMVGSSTCSFAKNAKQVKTVLEAIISAQELDMELVDVGCNGMCYAEVLVEVAKRGGSSILYTNVTPDNASSVLTHFNDYLPGCSPDSIQSTQEVMVKNLRDEPFYALQERNILEYVGRINPYSLDEYVAVGGYEGLRSALSMAPEDVIREVSDSGLRGRGGAGFPTGIKLRFTRAAKGEEKYMVCNADEGDPGAFMNRLTAEGNPFMIVEGLTIAAYAIGASKGYIFVRAEKPLMAERLGKAVASAKKGNYLGENILGNGYSLDVEVMLSAGAFICGEETALIAAIEGRRAMPRPRPPYPATKGLWGKPTTINNLETLAQVSLVFGKGSRWFSEFGSEKSKGTKVFCLAGSILKSGAAEVPMGTSIKRLIFDIGGGSPDGSSVKAVQIGGPSGGCIPIEYFDYGLDYESLTSLGAIMGSGGLIVLTESNCMVDLARYFLTFTSAESCGECVPCRIGLTKMLNTLTGFVSGKGKQEDLISLTNMCHVIADSSLCALGQTAPNPVLTMMNYFGDECLEHIQEGKCRAKVCTALLRYEVDQESCTRCQICVRNCPVTTIEVRVDGVVYIKQEGCIRCGTCKVLCPFNAVKTS